MRDILAPSRAGILEVLTRSNPLLGFDLDGTLAPIVSDPGEVRMRATTRRLLRLLAQLYPCIVITGRARADARRCLWGVEGLEVIGNHGLEPWRGGKALAAEVRTWVPLLRRRLEWVRGVEIEDKVFSLAVHYRRSRPRVVALGAILDAAADLGRATVRHGRCVVNLIPAGAPSKGDRLQAACRRRRCEIALFVGDDETDEDAFAQGATPVAGVRVGWRRHSRAAFFIASQARIDVLLKRLIELRRPAIVEGRALRLR